MSWEIRFDKTVFIVGAGAHKPYGFPLGSELTDLILSLRKLRSMPQGKVSPHRKIVLDLIGELGFTKTMAAKRMQHAKKLRRMEIESLGVQATSDELWELDKSLEESLLDLFLEHFAGSQAVSVDRYLSRPKQDGDLSVLFSAIGKALICYFIDHAENREEIGFHAHDWIQFLINEYLIDGTQLDAFLSSPPKVFTFNYDTFYERSLHHHLVYQHGIGKAEAFDAVQKLWIEHIYGELGAFNRQKKIRVSDFVRHAYERIQVVGEERSRDKLDALSRSVGNAMEQAEVVYFLGFGFDDQNCELLFRHFDRANAPKVEFYATDFKMSKATLLKLKRSLPVRVRFGNEADGTTDCTSLLSEIKPVFQRPVVTNRKKKLKKKRAPNILHEKIQYS